MARLGFLKMGRKLNDQDCKVISNMWSMSCHNLH